MRAIVGRFVRGMIDEDLSSEDQQIDHDAVFDRERIAAALERVQEEELGQ